MELLHQEITEQIIGAMFEVYRELGYGFLEAVYQKAMQVELQLRGLVADGNVRLSFTTKGPRLVTMKPTSWSASA
jgi:GxxExxY protein